MRLIGLFSHAKRLFLRLWFGHSADLCPGPQASANIPRTISTASRTSFVHRDWKSPSRRASASPSGVLMLQPSSSEQSVEPFRSSNARMNCRDRSQVFSFSKRFTSGLISRCANPIAMTAPVTQPHVRADRASPPPNPAAILNDTSGLIFHRSARAEKTDCEHEYPFMKRASAISVKSMSILYTPANRPCSQFLPACPSHLRFHVLSRLHIHVPLQEQEALWVGSGRKKQIAVIVDDHGRLGFSTLAA